ncbi:U3 small nucleolar RNA-associated protein 14 homolog A [Embiotoca jacksoni]|uniref:U3 small nucleolar RNA-associated protein 14 homolog A n=1 Tax=Embiotoca jacksoni TaxID=100190 RepID=UPI003703EE88
MAKAPKRKVSKKSLKKSSDVTDQSSGLKAEEVHDEEEEEDLKGADEDITSEEDEDERKRQKLVEAIGGLGGTRRRGRLGERSEAALTVSEFTVSAEGEADRVDLSDLVGTLDKTPAVPAKTRKQLKSLQRGKTIDCPLSKQDSERIQRDVAFQRAAAEVSRWKSIITQNQRAEQLVFPLNQEPPGPRPMERVVTGWRAKTPLEQEIFALLSANKQPINDPILTPAEEASLRAMSLEEAKIRRAELQKARALQSYYEAKTRRERKIKSKKYHRVQNKAKRKEFLKQFDEMVKTDPAGALEELRRMERARMQERMSLKHQNSGKWAKSKAIMAKYDEGARKAMQQQLEVNKDLTQKLVTSLTEEEEEQEEEQEEEVLPDFVNDAERGLDSTNPWMRGRLSEEPTERETSDAQGLTAERAGDAAEEEEEEQEEVLLREFDSRRKLRQAEEADTTVGMPVDGEEEEEKEKDKTVAEEEEEEDIAAAEEEEGLSEFTALFRAAAGGSREADAVRDMCAPLQEGLRRIRTLEDVDLLTQEDSGLAAVEPPQLPPSEDRPAARQQAGKTRKRKRGIELKDVLTKDTKDIKVPLAPTVEDGEEPLDQRGLIKEAFAGDDVVSDFLKDKRRQEDTGKPEVDLTLPGWGEWGGTGLKLSRSKRRRFRVKKAPPPPRTDRHLPSVIISEKRSGSVGLHRVSSLPFPFENQAQFESTIRTPLGRTWNTEHTVRKVTQPRLLTQPGAIIQPMEQEELERSRRPESTGRGGRQGGAGSRSL